MFAYIGIIIHADEMNKNINWISYLKKISSMVPSSFFKIFLLRIMFIHNNLFDICFICIIIVSLQKTNWQW